ncbi:jg20976 [Pararge aegeria aegeria]|uniref:Jg20976 protein n=1 Tax=Pararge aegeria aegeria TaxID=348720 RepID=A0A8S4RBY5_9NEOP|nr:jg20976 [Pararge aegeria aegeria]
MLGVSLRDQIRYEEIRRTTRVLLLLLPLGLSPYLVGRNLPLYVVPLVRLTAGSLQKLSRPPRSPSVLQGVMLGSQGMLRVVPLLLYIGVVHKHPDTEKHSCSSHKHFPVVGIEPTATTQKAGSLPTAPVGRHGHPCMLCTEDCRQPELST